MATVEMARLDRNMSVSKAALDVGGHWFGK